MTDIEQKALAMVREVLNERNLSDKRAVRREVSPYTEALCRAIERHEAFRQEVSDAVWRFFADGVLKDGYLNWANNHLGGFIIGEPKPDPLVDALEAAGFFWEEGDAEEFRAALDARGFEIREKGQ